MQCDANIIYQNLLKNLKRINASMRDLEMVNLPDLLKEHDKLIGQIKEHGLSNEPELKDLLNKNLNQVQNVISETEKVQLSIAKQLKTIGNKQKLDSVYTKKKYD
ncbi:MAG: hypothetical protein GY714_00440 [Desulfobacterales bacterium]|nr:hypothetical protein [Desulfobacterales bacterium]MCP4159608.1 hypothetical protein [Deltaproteobacteria bacterium]